MDIDDATLEQYEAADEQAVLDHVTKGTPIDPETYRRVRARGEKITERLRQQYGEMNIAVDLIREIRGELPKLTCKPTQTDREWL